MVFAKTSSQLLIESPNKKYTFILESGNKENRSTADNSGNTFILTDTTKIIWQSQAGTIDSLVASWSPNSDYILYVDENRVSIKFISNIDSKITVHKIDITSLLQKGKAVIDYNWNIPNQGSIPHDLITDIKNVDSNNFYGIYVRAKFPKRVVILFKLKLFFDENKFIKSKIIIKKSLIHKWNEDIPNINFF